MEPDPNDNLIKKMLTSKTGANSCCYYSPHPDGEHLLYKWTAYGDSKNVRWYACAGCRSVKNKDNSKPNPPKSKRDEEAQIWIISPLELNQAHYCTPLEMSKEIGKQITYGRKKILLKMVDLLKHKFEKLKL